jgi:hypothetical protein
VFCETGNSSDPKQCSFVDPNATIKHWHACDPLCEFQSCDAIQITIADHFLKEYGISFDVLEKYVTRFMTPLCSSCSATAACRTDQSSAEGTYAGSADDRLQKVEHDLRKQIVNLSRVDLADAAVVVSQRAIEAGTAADNPSRGTEASAAAAHGGGSSTTSDASASNLRGVVMAAVVVIGLVSMLGMSRRSRFVDASRRIGGNGEAGAVGMRSGKANAALTTILSPLRSMRYGDAVGLVPSAAAL